MNTQDFNRLFGLLAKLDAATHKATQVDGSFRKYHTHSIEVLKDMPLHLKKLEQGLKTAKIVNYGEAQA